MSHYVILNFEDPDPGAGHGPIRAHVTRKATALPGNVKGSASDTVAGTIGKARRKETRFGKNSVHHYSCVELAQADKAKTLGRSEVQAIREDIRKAKKIYIIMHGKPDDTEKGFSNMVQGQQVEYTWKELANLALLLFPDAGHTYRITLIMCYGARTGSYRMNQNGTLPPNELKSSFAYKFFRAFAASRNVVMTAMTGQVQTEKTDGTNLVETEETVAATLDHIAYKKDTATRAALKAQKQTWDAHPGLPKGQYDELQKQFALNPDADPGTDPLKIFLKQYYFENGHRNALLLQAKSDAAAKHGGKSSVDKYGRIVYRHTNGVLTISNKYGDPANGVPANQVLYNGPLLL